MQRFDSYDKWMKEFMFVSVKKIWEPLKKGRWSGLTNGILNNIYCKKNHFFAKKKKKTHQKLDNFLNFRQLSKIAIFLLIYLLSQKNWRGFVSRNFGPMAHMPAALSRLFHLTYAIGYWHVP